MYLYCKLNTFYLRGKMLPEPTTKKARKAIKIKIQESRRGKKPVLTHKARDKGAQ